jgi:nitrogen regulatory protein P-II 1
MKEIKAIIRPTHLHKIQESFRHLPGFPGMNISHVEGCSSYVRGSHTESIKEALTEFTQKLRIEIVVADELAADIVYIIHRDAHTGQAGDGILWVTDVHDYRRLCIPLDNIA